MSKKDKKEEVEVVASHNALNLVAGWLGMSADEATKELDSAKDAVTVQSRTPFMGLGAKYLPHKKAVGFAAALDNKLKKRLEAGQKRSKAQETEELNNTGKAANQTSGNGVGQHDGSDDEDAGKAKQVKKRLHTAITQKLATPQQAQRPGNQNQPSHNQGKTLQPQKTDGPERAAKHEHREEHAGLHEGNNDGRQDENPATEQKVSSRAAREAWLLGAGQPLPGNADTSGSSKKKRKKKKGNAEGQGPIVVQ